MKRPEEAMRPHAGAARGGEHSLRGFRYRDLEQLSGHAAYIVERSLAQGVASIAVLARNWSDLDGLRAHLEHASIPFTLPHAEYHRLYYVALTRARAQLVVCALGQRHELAALLDLTPTDLRRGDRAPRVSFLDCTPEDVRVGGRELGAGQRTISELREDAPLQAPVKYACCTARSACGSCRRAAASASSGCCAAGRIRSRPACTWRARTMAACAAEICW